MGDIMTSNQVNSLLATLPFTALLLAYLVNLSFVAYRESQEEIEVRSYLARIEEICWLEIEGGHDGV